MDSQISSIFQAVNQTPLGKGEARKRDIILKSIELVADEGIDACTFDRVAKEVGSTRPLLNHYFKNRENLFFLAAEMVRLKIQTSVIEKMKHAKSSEDLLFKYINANLSWYKDDPSTLKFYTQYLLFSSSSKKLSEQNNKYVLMGLKRIEEIILKGVEDNEFNISHSLNAKICARNIQLQITGALISFSTEHSQSTKNEILGIVKSTKLLLGIKTSMK